MSRLALPHTVVFCFVLIGSTTQAQPATTPTPLPALGKWLAVPREQRPPLDKTDFAAVPLSRADAERAAVLLWQDHAAFIRNTRETEMRAEVIELDGRKMKFKALSFGDAAKPPAGGRSLFFSLHGGGGAPARVNDSQWQNQIQLGRAYAPAEGIYLAPRAPTDNWNLWHEAHIDRFLDRLIQNLIVLANVNPDRVYVLGYSAGGDGVYQLAPRMADRFAAASMMAGHPNEASPLGLRNLPFAIQVGALDNGFNRNKVAAEWGKKLDQLQAADPDGYIHFTELHAGKPHWMDRQDRKAIPWMEKFSRNPLPTRIVWRQDDVTHDQFYWLAIPPNSAKQGQELRADREANTINLKTADVPAVIVRLNDNMVDLDKAVTIRTDRKVLFTGAAPRTIHTLAQTLSERGDPRLVFSAQILVKID